jgi:hypothetical protein
MPWVIMGFGRMTHLFKFSYEKYHKIGKKEYTYSLAHMAKFIEKVVRYIKQLNRNKHKPKLEKSKRRRNTGWERNCRRVYTYMSGK